MSPVRTVLILGLLIMAGPARAEEWVEPEQRCDGNTPQIVDCLVDRAAQWEKRMNTAYKQALADAEPKQREMLVAAQRFWIQYREANCDYCDLGPGTISSIQFGHCMKDLTETRARELERHVERH